MGGMPADFIAAVSAHTGVPAEFLTGDTAAEVWDSAQRLVDWKASTATVAADRRCLCVSTVRADHSAGLRA